MTGHAVERASADDVVVLRESELDTDLPTAIARIRADAATRGARILIVGPETELRAPAGDEPPEPPLTVAQLGRLAEIEVLGIVGGRFAMLVDCFDAMLDEARQAAERLAEDAVDASRARIRRGVLEVGSILEWVAEVARDLRGEAASVRAGVRRCALDALLAEVVAEHRRHHHEPRIALDPSAEPAWVTVRAAELSELLHLALGLVARRVGDAGSIRVGTAHRTADVVAVEIVGYGEVREVDAPAAIARLRALVAAQGGRLTAAGPPGGRAGIAVELPRC